MSFKNILTLLLSTRFERSSYAISSILLISSQLPSLPANVYYFIIQISLLYSIGGIVNAKLDNDYENLFGVNRFVAVLIVLSLLFGLIDITFLYSALVFIGLGFLYNTIARKYVGLDITVSVLTHILFPMIITSILVQQPIFTDLSGSAVIAVWFLVGHIKNLKDIEDDRARGYRTIPIKWGESGILITQIMASLGITIAFVCVAINAFVMLVITHFLMCASFIWFLVKRNYIPLYHIYKPLWFCFIGSMILHNGELASSIAVGVLFVYHLLAFFIRRNPTNAPVE